MADDKVVVAPAARLNAQDRQRLEAFFALGRRGLYDLGMLDDAIDAFLDRKDVKTYAESLVTDYSKQREGAAREKFIAKRNLGRLAPAAINVYGKALRGIEYETDAEGRYVKKNGKFVPLNPALVDANQLSAANSVLDRLDIKPSSKTVNHVDVTVNSVLYGDRAVAHIDDDPTLKDPTDQAQAREMLRRMVEVALGVNGPVAKIRERVTEIMAEKQGRKPKNVKDRLRRRKL